MLLIEALDDDWSKTFDMLELAHCAADLQAVSSNPTHSCVLGEGVYMRSGRVRVCVRVCDVSMWIRLFGL